MELGKYYRVNSPDVSSEIIEQEALIINFTDGAYYSTRDTGAIIWGLLGTGVKASEITKQLVSHYGLRQEQAEQDVQEFLLDLDANGLIVVADVQAPNNHVVAFPVESAYMKPELVQNTDTKKSVIPNPLGLQASYRHKHKNIVNEVFEGETVVVDLLLGLYYSFQGNSGVVWEWINRGASLQQIVDTLVRTYDVNREVVEKVVKEFVGQLLEEQLILVDRSQEATDTIELASDDLTTQFTDLQYERFADLQELLLLDPIHEVDEAGWPQQAR